MEKVYATFSSKGQLVIPAAIREALGIEAGTRVAIRQEGTRVILEPETRKAKLELVRKMCGITAGGPSMTDALLEERRLERERELREEGW
ncbi:MAG TPA: AbrB/MazE/SpoVT family DNA-binding domain-containing protein [Terracidiphilus sp.]|jgi:AbrB family looped-hinge helix DNA binding protein|nr:AbrB/MazE/SpoVT family DNA-binding domain-containing protein [Terracidiphilus sp.]